MFPSEDGNIIINAVDGLPNVHPNYNELELQTSETKNSTDGSRTLDELIHDEDLPTSLIVTNIDSSVFHNEEAKVRLCSSEQPLYVKSDKLIGFDNIFYRKKFKYYFHNLENLNPFSFLGALGE